MRSGQHHIHHTTTILRTSDQLPATTPHQTATERRVSAAAGEASDIAKMSRLLEFKMTCLTSVVQKGRLTSGLR